MSSTRLLLLSFRHQKLLQCSFNKQNSLSTLNINWKSFKRLFSSTNFQEESQKNEVVQKVVTDKKPFLGDWVKITFKTREGEVFESPVRINQSVMDAAVENDIAMHGSCDGKLCCSTCHVYVDEAYSKFIPEITEEEEDMLDITPLRETNSRLSCQILVTKELDGAEFVLPYEEETFNYDA